MGNHPVSRGTVQSLQLARGHAAKKKEKGSTVSRKEALEKLRAETTEARLTDAEYAACVEAALPGHARRKWSTAYFRARDPRQGCMGQRPAVDAALRECAREAGEVYQVGNGQGWRAAL